MTDDTPSAMIETVDIDDNMADLLDLAATALRCLSDVVEARYAGDLLDAIEGARRSLQNEPLEDALLTVREVSDRWHAARDARRGLLSREWSRAPEPQSLRAVE